MKSTIKIEFDFDTKEPYIHAVIKPSEDLRDQMLRNFFEKLGEGNLIRVNFGKITMLDGVGEYKSMTLHPVETAIMINDKDESPLLFPMIDDNGYIGVIPTEKESII